MASKRLFGLDEAASVVHLSVLLLVLIPSVVSLCGPVEEKTPTDVTCEVTAPESTTILWKYELDNGFVSGPVATCDLGQSCDVPASSYSAKVELVTGDRYNSTLSIPSVARTKYKWVCQFSNGTAVDDCELEVYTKPDVPKIDEPQLLNSTHLRLFAYSQRAYPSAKCLFYLRELQGEETRLPDEGVRYTTIPIGSDGDVIVECELMLPVTFVSAAIPSFKVTMYPDFTDSRPADGVNSSYTVPISGLDQGLVCDPVLEDTDRQFRCSALTANITWQYTVDNLQFVPLSTCSGPTGGCIDESPSHASAEISSEDQFGYYSTLTLHGINRAWLPSGANLSCVSGNSNVISFCKLHIVTKPSPPVCENPQLSPNQKSLSVTCDVAEVFPEATCNFDILSGNITFTVTSPGVHQAFNNSAGATSYSLTCVLNINLRELGTGSHRFRVEVIPDLADVKLYPEPYSSKSAFTGPVTLSLPEAEIESGCLAGGQKENLNDGYIRAGSSASCECRLTTVGFPPGSVQWDSPGGQQEGQPNNNDSVSTLLIDSSHLGTYTCTTQTALSYLSPGKTFTPELAFGPSIATIRRTDGGTDVSFDVCLPTADNLTVICAVEQSNVNPKPIFTVKVVDDQTLVDGEFGQEVVSRFEYRHTFLPKGGLQSIACEAHNSKFPDISANASFQVIVRVPPPGQPAITVGGKSGGEITVKPDSPVEVKCHVQGGFPPVDDVTLACGSSGRTTSVGDSASHVITLHEGGASVLCTCTATHSTNCYARTSEVRLTPEGPQTSGSDLDIAVIAGAAGGGVVILLIVVSTICVCRYRRKYKEAVASKPDGDYDPMRSSRHDWDNPYLEPEIYDTIKDDGYEVPPDPEDPSSNTFTSDYIDVIEPPLPPPPPPHRSFKEKENDYLFPI
ncbi:uncharacterized protein LOC101859704 [Aplysia californica]|uniref:Uncharacterized protein LOC101859704 n=1 Tax=Aplysia californica TaxID=6500 RepID=A0ABM0ZZJ3_APLCA|nr:uncharacterized protein LOC101859704 [Aplysia californica]